MIEDIVLDLDIDSAKMFKVNYGEFDTLGLSATYHLKFEEFKNSLFGISPENTLPEAIKTKFHELTHLFQMLSTPYGYYYHLIGEFQNDRVEAIAYTLKEKYDIKLKFPLIKLIKALDKEKYYEIWFNVYLWYAAEYVKLFFIGDVQKCLDQGTKNSLLGKLPMIEHMAILDFYMADSYNRTGGHVNYETDNLDKDEASYRQESSLIAAKVMVGLEVSSMLESWAKVIEYWTSDKQAQNNIYQDVSDKFSNNDQISYYWMIQQFSHGGKINNLREFIFTYTALCELSLFGLLPPHLSELRALQKTDLASLHPLTRFTTAASKMPEMGIAPVRNLHEDHERFMDQLCSELEWVTPKTVVEHCSKNANYSEGNMHDMLFYWARS